MSSVLKKFDKVSVVIFLFALLPMSVSAQTQSGPNLAAGTVVESTHLFPQSSQEVAGDDYSRKEPALSGILSALIPGTGQFYNGQAGKGALMLGAAAASVAIALTAGIGDEEVCFDGFCETAESQTNSVFYIGLGAAAAITIWSVVDAIGSANRLNKEHDLALKPSAPKKPQARLTLQPDLRNGKPSLIAGLQVTH